jgi:CO/xanthine dehydrogenase Mo-binding subunit
VEVEGTYVGEGQAFTYGAGAAVVNVDRETGIATLVDLVVVVDAGRALDRDVVRGQLLGGAAHGVGGALFERMAHDDDGEPLVVGFRDYHVPLAADLPAIDARVLELVPSPQNPLGVRGVGEIAVAIAAAAVANAVADTGASVTTLPVDPASIVARHG